MIEGLGESTTSDLISIHDDTEIPSDASSSPETSPQVILSNHSSDSNGNIDQTETCGSHEDDSDAMLSSSSLISKSLREKLAMLTTTSDSVGTSDDDTNDCNQDQSSNNGHESHLKTDKTYDDDREHSRSPARIFDPGLTTIHPPDNDDDSSTSSSNHTSPQPSAVKEFRHLIERQKNYLNCLQKELNRLQKMEKVLSRLHHSSKRHKKLLNSLSSRQDTDTVSSSQSRRKISENIGHHGNIGETFIREPEPTSSSSSLDDVKTSHHSSCSTDPSPEIPSSDVVTSMTPCLTCKYLSTTSCDSSKPDSKTQSPKRKKNGSIQHRIKLHEVHKEGRVNSVAVQTSASLFELPVSVKTAEKNGDTELNLDSTKKNSVAWTIPPIRPGQLKFSGSLSRRLHSKSRPDYLEDTSQRMTLQQAFKSKCSHLLERSESRVRKINIKSAIRRATAECRIERRIQEYILENKIRKDLNEKAKKVKTMKPRKIFTDREMKQQTERLCSHLPEIQKRRQERKREEGIRTHRLMARLFSQNLKSNAVKGKTSFKMSQKLTF